MLCVAGSILNWAGAELGQAIKVPNYVGKRDPVDYYILGMGGIGTGAALHQHGSCPCSCLYLSSTQGPPGAAACAGASCGCFIRHQFRRLLFGTPLLVMRWLTSRSAQGHKLRQTWCRHWM